MRQLITLAILAAIAVGGWFAWPTIKAKFLAYQDNPAPSKDPDTTPQMPTPPGTNPSGTNPVTPDLGTKTSISPVPPDAKTSEGVSSTGTGEKTPDRPVTGKTLRVDFGAELVTLGPMSTIEGTTTLPVGAVLELRAVLEGVPEGAQPTAEKVIVVGGSPRNTIRWVPTRSATAKSFRLSVTLHPELQPPAVQQLIGPHGELLTGPLVLPAASGNYLQIISASFSPPSGGASAIAKARRLKLVFKAGDETTKGKAP